MATTVTLDAVSPLSSLPQAIKKNSLVHEQLDLAQQQLLSCINSLTTSASLFTKASLAWHQLLWWQKITMGSLLCLPIVLGLISQVALLSLFGLSLIFFSGLSFFLVDNHVKHHQLQTEEIKSTVMGLIKLLGTMLENLELVNTQLEEELHVLKRSNKVLTKKCTELQEETKRLVNSNQSLDQNQKELLAVQKKLKTTILTIDSTVGEQTTLLEKSQSLLEETTLAYQKNQLQLTATITELDEVKKTLAAEVTKAQRVTQTLKNTVQKLSEGAIGDQRHRDQFFQKLDSLMNDQEVQFDTIVKGLANSEQQLSETAQEIKASNLRFNNLLNQQEQLLGRRAPIETPPQNTATELRQGRQQHGFYVPATPVKTFESATATPILVAG